MDGQHDIWSRTPGHVYITPVPHSNDLHQRYPPSCSTRTWHSSSEVWEFIAGTEFVICPEDRDDWVIVGPRATEGCYIEGGTFKGYIEEEIGLYLDERAEIRWPDHMYSLFKLRGSKIEK